MTRQEAINDIKDNILPVVGGQSLEMAIRSLEAWNEIIKFVEDYYDVPWEYEYDGGIKDACVDILEEIETHLKGVES